MAKNQDLAPAVRMVRGFLYPECGITPLYAICDVLQIPARVVAAELEVTTSQMSHYRTGQTEVPVHRMEIIIKLLKRLIADIEKEVERERKKVGGRKRTALISDLERRIALAKEIADL